MSLTIRELTETDADVMSSAFAAIGWNKPTEQYREYIREQEAGRRVVLVAEWEGDFAGYVTIAWQSDYPAFKAADIPEIQDLNVLPRFRRRGIAGRLLDGAEGPTMTWCCIS